MSMVEGRDAVCAQALGEGDERGVNHAGPQAGLGAEDPQRPLEGLRPPAHLVGAPLEVRPYPLGDSPPGPALEDVIDLGEGQRCGEEIVSLGEDPVAHSFVVRLIGDGQGDHDRGVEDYRHSPKPVAAR